MNNKILIVDDEPTLLEHLAFFAQEEGRLILTASSAKEAINYINQHDIDVVVTDLKMQQEFSGLEVLKAAKERNIYTQVIILTAHGSKQVSIEAMKLGAYDYIPRGAYDISTNEMVKAKIGMALEYREGKILLEEKNGSKS